MSDGQITPPIWLMREPRERTGGLNRKTIGRAAVALADADGLHGLTLRAVARQLDAAPMSLYRYIQNKDGLFDLMLDEVLAEVATSPAPMRNWRVDVTAVARAMWGMVNRHRWYARVVYLRPPAGPNSCRIQEFLLATFVEQGVDLPTASTYRRLIDGHVLGIALEQATIPQVGLSGAAEEKQIRQIARQWWSEGPADGDYPLLGELMSGFMAGSDPGLSWPDPNTRFELGLEFLLDGIGQQIEGEQLEGKQVEGRRRDPKA